MMITGEEPQHILAIFASDRGPGDPERASLMSQAGALMARRGFAIACLAEGSEMPMPLVTSARTAGAPVMVIADEDFVPADGLRDIPVERVSDPELRLARLADVADGFIGLPGSLLSARAMFSCWVEAGGGSSGKPVALLNRNRAFEVLRGYALDVLSHSVANSDRLLIISDSLEDIATKMQRMLKAG